MRKLVLSFLLAAVATVGLAPAAHAQTTLTLTDERFVCAGPLADLGPLPIVLEQTLANSSAAAQHVQGAIDLRSGCQGDGDPATTDLVIHQYGNGADVGPGWDALVMRLGAHDLNITGFLNCGALAPGAHQDGLDVRGGEDVTFTVDIGDWDSQTATCHGAGGLLYLSGFQNGGPLGDRASDYVTNVVCIECRMVGSKPEAGAAGRAAFIVESVNSGAIDSCFAANLAFQIRLDDGTRGHGAIDPVDTGPYANGENLKIDRDDGVPDDPTLCQVVRDGDPPPPPPPPPPCDAVCVLTAQVAELEAENAALEAEIAALAQEVADCRRKLSEQLAYFLNRPFDGTVQWAFKMRVVIGRAYGCTGIK